MSSEQQERQAMQYAERSLMLTVRTLLKVLEWSARQALAQDSAYKIGVQKLEELLQIAISWQGDYLHFYAKDKSLLDRHLEELLKKLTSDPEKLRGLTFEQTLDEEIAKAKEKMVLSEPSAVKTKEVTL
ncbi:TPA: hypothetical protein ACJS2Z_000920 [Streptococcus agalactiae]